MRIRTLILLLVVCLAAASAFAEQAKDGRLDIDTFLKMNRLHGPAHVDRNYFEGFEGGVLPGDWTQTITDPNRPWGVTDGASTGSIEGSFTAFVGYDADNYQNELITFDHLIDVAGGEYVLTFWMAGSRGQSWSENATETVEVNGTTVFDFDSSTEVDQEWVKFAIDLSAYDGQTVTIGFRYEGQDGDLHTLDAVAIDDGTGYDPPPPPPAPENDTCEGVIDLQVQGMTSFQVDLCQANDTFSPGEYGTSCTGYSAAGNDVVYSINLAEGETFNVTELGDHDNSMYLVTDCADPVNTCVAGADDTYTGDPEVITYTAAAAGTYYLIVDGYSGCSVVTVTIDAPVSTEAASWGSVKGMYR